MKLIRSNAKTFGVVGIFVSVVIIIIIWLTIAGTPNLSPLSGDRVTVAASIFPLSDIARNIGGEHVNVVQLLPSGASPHTYALTPAQLASVQDAKSLFVIGHNLDTWATEAVSKVANIPTVVVDSDIELREFEDEHGHEEEHGEDEHEEGSIDPHYWLTIPNAQTIAKTIAMNLQQADPDHYDDYENNLQQYIRELDAVEAELHSMVQQGNQTEFIAIHDGWSYFADHYNLDLVATYEPVEGRQPSVRDIQELQEIIAEHGISTFFTEPQKQSTGATRFLSQDLGLDIQVLDPVGGTGDRDSYIEMMKENVQAIVK